MFLVLFLFSPPTLEALRVSSTLLTCMKEVLLGMHVCERVKGNETDESVACFVGICCRG